MHIGSCACVQIVVALPDAEAQVFKFEMSDVESHYQASLPRLWALSAPRSTVHPRACVRVCVFVCVLRA